MNAESINMPVAKAMVIADMTTQVEKFIKYALSSPNHIPGTYYFGIIASACYLESVLEEYSHLWCAKKSSSEKNFENRLMEVIAQDVSKATGLNAWKKWLKTLYEVDFPKVIGEDWKALDILFTLRNQLAHGRTTKFAHFYNADNGKFLGMTIKGSSYETAFQHLIEKGIIKIEEGCVPSATSILTANVVYYFWSVVDRSIMTLQATPELRELR